MEDEKSFRKRFLMNYLQIQQEEYESFWVRNVWGFGDKMRDYLMEGLRRIRHG
ncbi:MAG: hypothetical protein J6Y20_09925 [Lachnospiraceae bacterium]|nr:hypothetical protein [Lachnospiraceae bacterium]